MITNSEADREPTQAELDGVPAMSQEDMVSVMGSAEYKNSNLVRKLVQASLAKSDHSKPVTEEPKAAPDDVAARQEYFAALFRSPRYKSDPLYRWEVAQKIKAATANDNFDSNTGNRLSMDDMKNGGTMRVSVSSAQGHGVDLSVKRFGRVSVGPDVSSLEMGMKPKAKKEYFPGVDAE
jgi:hypothetical protein